MAKFDSLLIYAYGGPESMEDVRPFLENISRGKRISQKRLEEVLGHYALFGGRSPMNAEIRAFMLRWKKFCPEFPVFYGCLYAKPALKETIRQMTALGCRKPLVFIPAPFVGYQTAYFEKLEEVRRELAEELSTGSSYAKIGAQTVLPDLEILPPFSADSLFLSAVEGTISRTLAKLPEARKRRTVLLFSVHSLPIALARKSGYEAEVLKTVEVLKKRFPCQTFLGWQSASASPIPWLGPSTLEQIRMVAELPEFTASAGVSRPDLVLIPVGFPFENMEVIYDLDVEARKFAESLGFTVHRAPTAGKSLEILQMVRRNFERNS